MWRTGEADSDPFHEDNRMGLEGTLHRISAIRNRDAKRSIIGLTYRIGRHVPGQPVEYIVPDVDPAALQCLLRLPVCFFCFWSA